jgi:phosphoribosylaminoimidazole-succinocarboxamide synthase
MRTKIENGEKKISKNTKRQIKSVEECELIIDQIKIKYPFIIESFLEVEDFPISDLKVEFVILKNPPAGSSDNYFARFIYKEVNEKNSKYSFWWDQDFILYNKLPII